MGIQLMHWMLSPTLNRMPHYLLVHGVHAVIVLMAGVLPDAKVALSVMGICLQITAWVYMLPAGLAR